MYKTKHSVCPVKCSQMRSRELQIDFLKIYERHLSGFRMDQRGDEVARLGALLHNVTGECEARYQKASDMAIRFLQRKYFIAKEYCPLTATKTPEVIEKMREITRNPFKYPAPSLQRHISPDNRDLSNEEQMTLAYLLSVE